MQWYGPFEIPCYIEHCYVVPELEAVLYIGYDGRRGKPGFLGSHDARKRPERRAKAVADYSVVESISSFSVSFASYAVLRNHESGNLLPPPTCSTSI
jgi:hypothetical protein